jgi:tRNA (cytosine38-C5)-methyltransferase
LLELNLRFFTPEEVARLHAFPFKFNLTSHENPLDELTCHEKTIPRSYNSLKRNYKGPYFEFPENISIIQKHRMLGNSLNCFVISELLRCILFYSS